MPAFAIAAEVYSGFQMKNQFPVRHIITRKTYICPPSPLSNYVSWFSSLAENLLQLERSFASLCAELRQTWIQEYFNSCYAPLGYYIHIGIGQECVDKNIILWIIWGKPKPIKQRRMLAKNSLTCSACQELCYVFRNENINKLHISLLTSFASSCYLAF